MPLPTRLRGTVATLARVVCAPRHEPAPATFEALASEIDRFLGSLPGPERVGLVGALWALELAPFPRRFSTLDPRRAEATFARWWDGRLHPLAKILKMVVSFAWWELPDVKREMGYTPERWIAESAAKRLAAWKDEIAAGERAVLAPDPLVPGPLAPDPLAKEERHVVAPR